MATMNDAGSSARPAGPPAGPPRWKMMVVIWLAIYPLVTLVVMLLGPHLRGLPGPVQTLIMTLLLVPAMTYVMMPLVQRALGGWLRGGTANAGERTTDPGSGRPTGA